jgi:hypothetical protein
MLIQDLRPQTLSCLHTRYAPDTSRLTASAWNALKSRLPCVGSPQARETMSRYRYAVTADGQRFLVNTPLEEANTSPITVVLNGRTGQKVRVQELRTIRAGILEARKVNSC